MIEDDDPETVQDDENGSLEDREVPVVSTILLRPTGFAGQAGTFHSKQDALRSPQGEVGLYAQRVRFRAAILRRALRPRGLEKAASLLSSRSFKSCACSGVPSAGSGTWGRIRSLTHCGEGLGPELIIDPPPAKKLISAGEPGDAS